MTQKIINQSLVKQVKKPEFCPRRYLEVDVLRNYSEEESIVMTRGKYFEYLATGAKDRNGEIPELPLTQKGKPSTPQIRIEWQAKQFAKNLEKHGIEIVTVGQKLSFPLFKEFLVTGIEDTEVLYQGQPAIMDIKLTADITNDFGDFAWGDFQRIDKLQAYTYTLLKYHLTGKVYRFIYYVADYKTKPEYKIEEVINPLDHYNEVYSRFQQTYLKLMQYEKNLYPEVPSEKCVKCPVSSCNFNGNKHKLDKQFVDLKAMQKELESQRSAKTIQRLMEEMAKYQRKKAGNYVEHYETYYE